MDLPVTMDRLEEPAECAPGPGQGWRRDLVTEHGRPIARLSPVGAEIDRMTALVDACIVRQPKTMTRRLPAERVRLTDGGSVDADIADQRR